MALQIIIERENIDCAAKVLRRIWEDIEVFEMCERFAGISIATKVLDVSGEDKVKDLLNRIRHYDLWEGRWKDAGQATS